MSSDHNRISRRDFNEANLWWKEKIGIDIEKKNKLIFAGNINNAFDFSNLIYALNSKKISTKLKKVYLYLLWIKDNDSKFH